MMIVFLGAAGSGKGTHAKIISKKTGTGHLSMGDALREAAEEKTALGKKINNILLSGKLVPFQITIKILKNAMKKPKYNNGIIFDGFPRNMKQVKAMEKLLSVDKVVFMDLTESEIIKRLGGRWTCKKCGEIYNIPDKVPKKNGICDKCGGELYQREDDTPKAIKRRFQVFKKEVMPVIKYYEKKGIVRRVSSKGSINEVAKRVWKAVL